MDITRDVPTPVSRDAFATWARIAVQYADGSSAMPLIRLDRQGLTVTVDAPDSPAIGLPRRALIVADATSLCELRLVARAAGPGPGDHTAAVTLQPSRADDDTLLWQALRAYQIHLGNVPASEGSERSTELAVSVAASPLLRASCSNRDDRANTVAGERGVVLERARTGDSRSRVCCDVAFILKCPEDAWFFSRWLDYHFAEVRAWARTSDETADLREMFMRVAEHEAEARFVFRSAERVARASTETACRLITAEAERALGMKAEHWLASTEAVADASRGLRRHAAITWHAGSHSFSSK